jgi:hypothetical protein
MVWHRVMTTATRGCQAWRAPGGGGTMADVELAGKVGVHQVHPVAIGADVARALTLAGHQWLAIVSRGAAASART